MTAASTHTLLSAMESWLAAGGQQVGEVIILRDSGGGFRLRQHADTATQAVTTYTTPESAREVAKYDAAGKFRPLKSAPTLIRGWEIVVPDVPALMLALNFLYPAALANWVRWLSGEALAVPLRESLGRQTGIYRVTALIRDDEAAKLVASTCAGKCLRHVMWTLDGKQNWSTLTPEKQTVPAGSPESGGIMPLLCIDPCPILVGGARSVVRRRMKAEGPAAPETANVKPQTSEKLQDPNFPPGGTDGTEDTPMDKACFDA